VRPRSGTRRAPESAVKSKLNAEWAAAPSKAQGFERAQEASYAARLRADAESAWMWNQGEGVAERWSFSDSTCNALETGNRPTSVHRMLENIISSSLKPNPSLFHPPPKTKKPLNNDQPAQVQQPSLPRPPRLRSAARKRNNGRPPRAASTAPQRPASTAPRLPTGCSPRRKVEDAKAVEDKRRPSPRPPERRPKRPMSAKTTQRPVSAAERNSGGCRMRGYQHQAKGAPASTKNGGMQQPWSSGDAARIRQLLSMMTKVEFDGDSTDMRCYKTGVLLGKGATAKVSTGWHRVTGEMVAIKSFDRGVMSDAKGLKGVMQEVKIMSRIAHPNIVYLYEAIVAPNKQAPAVSLVMEHVPNGTLLGRFRRLKPEEDSLAITRCFMSQLLLALAYLHANNICHRDVKLENCLVQTGDILKLGDFGLSARCTQLHQGLCEPLGTPIYQAPEIRQSGKLCYGKQVDVWSAGVMLYMMTVGSLPFDGDSDADLTLSICEAKIRVPPNMDPDALELIRGMLTVSSEHRCTSLQAAQHPWLVGKAPELRLLERDNGAHKMATATMGKLGFSHKLVEATVESKKRNCVSTCYQLLLKRGDKKTENPTKEKKHRKTKPTTIDPAAACAMTASAAEREEKAKHDTKQVSNKPFGGSTAQAIGSPVSPLR